MSRTPVTRSIILVGLALIGCGAAALVSAWYSDRTTAVQAAVFRYQLSRTSGGGYLTVGEPGVGHDPDWRVLARLSDLGQRVRPASAFRADRARGAVPRSAGDRLYVWQVRWESPVRALVSGGRDGGFFVQGETYVVELRLGRWAVVEERAQWGAVN